jgi:hypothetical protein
MQQGADDRLMETRGQDQAKPDAASERHGRRA